VVIIDDPEKEPTPDNLVIKESGEKCKHLLGDKPGEYSCAIHDKDWYQDTPCYAFTQVETGNTNCRMGEYILGKEEVK